MIKIPTLYSDYRECMLDLDIYGKIVATPQQSIQELTETLFEEFQRRKPMPTLEYKRYELSRLVNPDFRIAYNKELELQDNERLLDLQSDVEASFENIDFEDLTSLIPTAKELFSYENHVTDNMRDEIISKYDLSTGEEFKPGISQTENIVGSVVEDDGLTLSEEKIANLGVDESEADVEMAEDPMEVVSFADSSEETKYEIEDDEVELEDDYSSEDTDVEDDYSSEDTDVEDEEDYDYSADDEDSDEKGYDYSSDEDEEEISEGSTDVADEVSDDSEDDDYEDYDSDDENDDSDDYDDYDSEDEIEESDDYNSEEVSEDAEDYEGYDSETDTVEDEDYSSDYSSEDETEEDYDDYGDENSEEYNLNDDTSSSSISPSTSKPETQTEIDLDDLDFDVDSFIDSVQDVPKTVQSEPIVNKVVQTPVTPIEIRGSTPPQSEIVDRSAEPTEIRAFLRKHPRCEYDFALKYFTKKQINDAIKIGKIIKKGNILKI